MTKESFKKLFDLYFEDIRRYIFYRSGNTALADDIAQQAFLRIWEKQIKLLPGKEKGLLYKIAGDEFIDHVRRKKRETDFANGFDFISESSSPDERIEGKELNIKFRKTLNLMKENQRIVFLLNRKEKYTYSEIAKLLGLSVKAVEKRMKGALDLLKKELL